MTIVDAIHDDPLRMEEDDLLLYRQLIGRVTVDELKRL